MTQFSDTRSAKEYYVRAPSPRLNLPLWLSETVRRQIIVHRIISRWPVNRDDRRIKSKDGQAEMDVFQECMCVCVCVLLTSVTLVPQPRTSGGSAAVFRLPQAKCLCSGTWFGSLNPD